MNVVDIWLNADALGVDCLDETCLRFACLHVDVLLHSRSLQLLSQVRMGDEIMICVTLTFMQTQLERLGVMYAQTVGRGRQFKFTELWRPVEPRYGLHLCS